MNSGNEFARILEAGRRKPGRDFFFFSLAIVQGGTIELLEQRTIRRWAGWHSTATLSAKFNPHCAVQILTEFL